MQGCTLHCTSSTSAQFSGTNQCLAEHIVAATFLTAASTTYLLLAKYVASQALSMLPVLRVHANYCPASSNLMQCSRYKHKGALLLRAKLKLTVTNWIKLTVLQQSLSDNAIHPRHGGDWWMVCTLVFADAVMFNLDLVNVWLLSALQCLSPQLSLSR